jgi:deazaflavin-dependent oxidoreductase (nitroreductase family)
MSGFSADVLEAGAREREIQLTTYGRKTGNPHTTTMWIWGDGERLFVTSGQGLERDWPQNLRAHGRAMLHVGDHELPVVPRHVSHAEARTLHPLITRKYGREFASSKDGEAPTPAEQATFELLPAPAEPAT